MPQIRLRAGGEMVPVRLAGAEVTEAFWAKLAGLSWLVSVCQVRINFSDQIPQVSITAKTVAKFYVEKAVKSAMVPSGCRHPSVTSPTCQRPRVLPLPTSTSSRLPA